jgi:hypothetical protein
MEFIPFSSSVVTPEMVERAVTWLESIKDSDDERLAMMSQSANYRSAVAMLRRALTESRDPDYWPEWALTQENPGGTT